MRRTLFVLFLTVLAAYQPAWADEVATNNSRYEVVRCESRDLDALPSARTFLHWARGEPGSTPREEPRDTGVQLNFEPLRPEAPSFLEQSGLMARRLWSRDPDQSRLGSVNLSSSLGLTGTTIREGTQAQQSLLGGYWIAIRDRYQRPSAAITASWRPDHPASPKGEPGTEPVFLLEGHVFFTL